MEGLTTALSRSSLDSSSSYTSNSTFDEILSITTDKSLGDSASVSDITSTEENHRGGLTDVISFNDRSMETRDARLATALYSLDEDLPHGIDENIKHLLKTHQFPQTNALGHMEFLVDENYLEYKSNLAAKRALEKKLPKSKGRKSTGQIIDDPANHTESTSPSFGSFQSLFHQSHIQYKRSHDAKRAHEKELHKSTDPHWSR